MQIHIDSKATITKQMNFVIICSFPFLVSIKPNQQKCNIQDLHIVYWISKYFLPICPFTHISPPVFFRYEYWDFVKIPHIRLRNNFLCLACFT